MENQEPTTENEDNKMSTQDFDLHIKKLADMGRRYPAEFMNDMSNIAFELVLDWMHKNNAPEEIIEIMNDGCVLGVMSRPEGNDPDLSLAEIPDMVSRITKMIYKNGGYLEAGMLIIRETSSVGGG